jgi:hypothetical protein
MQADSQIMAQCQLNIAEGWAANETKIISKYFRVL